MHVEFANCLNEILEQEQEHYRSELVAIDIPRSVSRVLERFAQVPSEITADFAHAGAFEWAKVLGRAGVSQSPLEVANRWRAEILNRHGKYFRAEIGSTGFLNISVSEEFRREFLEVVARDGAQKLFSRKTLVLDCCENTYSNEQFLSRPFRWDLILDRARRLHGDDVQLLLDDCREKDLLDPDTRLMLLGLAIEPELDIESFRRGWGSFENLPWVWRKFGDDSYNFVQMAKGISPEPNTGRAPSSALHSILKSALTDLEHFFLLWRYLLLDADRIFRPELLVSHLHSSIRVFYRFYHHPAARNLQKYPEFCYYWQRLAALSAQLDGLVREIPGRLKFLDSRLF